MRCFGKSNAKAVQKKKAILQNETISVDLTLVDSTTVEVLVDRRLRPLHEVSHPPRQVDGTHGSQYALALEAHHTTVVWFKINQEQLLAAQ